MSQVNRYSRPAQVAKFNPLSAQEIMAIPLLKQEMEDKQIASNREELKALYDTKAVGADQEKINAKKGELEKRIKDLSNDIATNGISSSRTKAFRTLKTDYDKALSLSGDIGHANAFVEKRDTSKENFYKSSLKGGWSKDKIDKYWEAYSSTQSAFNKDGSFNTEYKEFGLPEYQTPTDQLLAEATKLGYTKLKDKNGVYIKTNTDAISNAIKNIKDRYADKSSPEGKLAILENWSPEKIYNDLVTAGREIRVWEEDHSWNEKLALSGAKIALKNQEKLAEEDAIKGEKVWELSPSIMKSAGIQKNAKDTEEHFKTLADKIESTRKKTTTGEATLEEVGILEDEYLGLKDSYRRVKKVYDETPVGITGKNNISLIEDQDDKTKAFFEAVDEGVKMTEAGGYYKVTTLIYNMTKDGKQKDYKQTDVFVSKDVYNKRERAKKLYENGFFKFVGGDASHIQDKEYVFTGENSTVKETKAAGKKVKESLIGMFKANSSELKFIQVGNLVDGKKDLLKSTVGSDAVDQQKRLMNVLSHLSDKIDVVSTIPGNSMHSPGFRVQIKIPSKEEGEKASKKYGDFAGQTLDIMVEVNPEGDSSLGKTLMTQTLKGTTADGETLASNNADYYQFGKFIPSPEDDSYYYNDDDIRRFIRNGSPFSKFVGKDDKVDLYMDEDTSNYKVKKEDKDGLTYNLEYKDILKGIGDSTESVYNFIKKNPMVTALVKEKLIREKAFENISIDSRNSVIVQAIMDLRESTEDVESSNYISILKLM